MMLNCPTPKFHYDLIRRMMRSLGIALLVIGITSIHFFINPTTIRIANVILAGGVALIFASFWPMSARVIARSKAIPSGAQLLADLGRSLTESMSRIEARTRAWHVAAVLAGLFVVSLVGSRGGILDIELDQYIPHYLSDRSFLAKTFDSAVVEGDLNAPKTMWHGREVTLVFLQRPRPLSYMIDCLDANAIAWSVSKGFPHLLSVSFMIFLFLNYLIVWIFCRRCLELDRFTSGLLVCLLASDPVLNCNFGFFRSAKPGTSTFMFAALCMIAVLLVRRRSSPPGAGKTLLLASIPILLLIACLFDEQGVLLTGVLVATLFIEWRFPAGPDTSTARFLMFAAIAALAVFGIYAIAIHPKLTVRFGDTPPLVDGLAYQKGALRNFALECMSRCWQAIVLLMDQFRYLTGFQVDLPAMLIIMWMAAATASGAAAIVAPDRADKGVATRRGVLLHLTAAAVLIVGMLAVLASRHESILDPDWRRWLYSEPTTMVFMLFLMLATAAILRSGRFSRPVVQLVLLGMFVGNLWSLPDHRRILRSGYWQPRKEISIAFLDALKKPGGKPVPPEIAASPAFHALQPYIPK
ncbi:MAG TPA: hypothetical protein VKB88_29160 [Bryobacteraceae bacterium]|nr:hypothetical protein [Bryobacteraceae bacterium]